MTKFTVDTAALERLTRTLALIHDELGSMGNQATGFEGMLGGRGLESEIEAFSGEWSVRATELQNDVADAIAHLSTATTRYEQTNGEVPPASGSVI